MFIFFIAILSALVIAYLIAFGRVISPRKRLDYFHKTPDEIAEEERLHGDHHH